MTARAGWRRVAASLLAGLVVAIGVALVGAQLPTATVGGGYAMSVHPAPTTGDEAAWSGGVRPIWQIDERREIGHRRLRYWRMQISGQNLMIPIGDVEANRIDLGAYPDHLRPQSLDDLFIYALYGETGWPLPALAYAADDRTQAGGPSPGWRTEWSLVVGAMPNGNPRILPLRPLWLGLLVDAVTYGAVALGLVELVRLARRTRRSSHGRCRSCGYDLAGINGPCPECGAVPRPRVRRAATT